MVTKKLQIADGILICKTFIYKVLRVPCQGYKIIDYRNIIFYKERIRAMINEKLSWEWVIVASVVFVIFSIFILPKVDKYSKKMLGQSKTPDTSFIYSSEDLYNMAENYGEIGRRVYIKLRWTFDVIWPIIYTSFLVLWTIKLSEYIIMDKFPSYLFIIPIIGTTFDFLENIGATIVMYRYPSKSGLIGRITPLMTFLKWIILGGAVLMIIILIFLI